MNITSFTVPHGASELTFTLIEVFDEDVLLYAAWSGIVWYNTYSGSESEIEEQSPRFDVHHVYVCHNRKVDIETGYTIPDLSTFHEVTHETEIDQLLTYLLIPRLQRQRLPAATPELPLSPKV